MAIRIPAAEARKNLANVVQKAQAGERIKLTRYNKTVAVLVPKNDLASLEECEEDQSLKSKARRRAASRSSPLKRGPVGK